MRRPARALAAAAAAVLLAAGAAACGDDDEPEPAPRGGAIQHRDANEDTTITVGSKDFTEQRVLGEIYAQGLEAAGFRVERELSLGNERDALRALERGVIDAYPEYTGTALLSLCGVPGNAVPKDRDEAFDQTRRCFARRGLTAFPPTPFTSSNEVGVTQATAQRYELRQISDLAAVDEEFTLYGPPECRDRADCLLGLTNVYGLSFDRFVAHDTDRRHDVLRGDAPVASIVFTTDPQNRRSGIVLLEDDKGMFPPYNSTFVVRDDVAEQAGADLGRVVELLQADLTDEVMQELNARVDLDQESPQDVARTYLEETGLVGASR